MPVYTENDCNSCKLCISKYVVILQFISKLYLFCFILF